MADIIQIRRDTAANWTSVNPTLADGEIGFETDTQLMKVGDGVSNWAALSYWFGGVSTAWGSITGTLSSQTDLQSALDNKEDAFTKNTAFNKDFGSAAGTVCEGDDSRLSDDRDPTAHASEHENGGVDEINVGGLSGLLADGQTPLGHASTHQNGGADEINVGGLSGLLADGQTPLAHNTSHQSGGADEIKLDDLGTPDDNTDLDSSTSRHGLLKKLSGNDDEFLDGQGNWSVPVAELMQSESDGESTTTSATWQTKTTITTGVIPAGTYRIGWFYEWGQEDDNAKYEFRVMVDGTTECHYIITAQQKKIGDSSRRSESGFRYVTLTNAAHTVTLQYRNNDGKTTYIRRGRLEMWRVS